MRYRSVILRLIFVCGTVVMASQAARLPLHAADAPAPAAPEKIYEPVDLDGLRGVRGKKVTVEGTIARAGESKSKTVRYLNFTTDYRDSLALVFFVSRGGDAFAMDKLYSWIGKRVRATGTVSEYGSNMQIEIEKWDQLTEIKKEAK